LSKTGKIDEIEAYSWTLPETARTTQVTPRLIEAHTDHSPGITVVTQATNRSTGRSQTVGYTLWPGTPPRGTPFGNSRIAADHVARTGRGDLYVGGGTGTVGRYFADLVPSARFGVDGIASSDDEERVVRYVPDADGRVLVAGRDGLTRLR